MFDITVTINFHREGAFALPALASMEELVIAARDAGLRVETRAILDSADDLTRQLVTSRGAWLDSVGEVSCNHPGLSRNKGTQAARGEFLAFLDGDDLWGTEWLRLAYEAATATDAPREAIWHPESLFFFSWNDFDRHSINQKPNPSADSCHYLHHSSSGTDLEKYSLLFYNFWSANAFARRTIHNRFPYKPTDKKTGFGIEDWSWNIETVWANISHRIVPDTVHIIRLKESGSQNQKDIAEGVLPYLPDHPWPNFGSSS